MVPTEPPSNKPLRRRWWTWSLAAAIAIVCAVGFALWNRSASEQVAPRTSQVQPVDPDARSRALVIGIWEDEYQGYRTMTLNEDGTGTIIVESRFPTEADWLAPTRTDTPVMPAIFLSSLLGNEDGGEEDSEQGTILSYTRQRPAGHAIGQKVPVYLTVVEKAWPNEQHAGWLLQSAGGTDTASHRPRQQPGNANMPTRSTIPR
jgi:hypothetical protein